MFCVRPAFLYLLDDCLLAFASALQAASLAALLSAEPRRREAVDDFARQSSRRKVIGERAR